MTSEQMAKEISARYQRGETTVDEALAEARAALGATGSDAAEWGPHGKRIDPLAKLCDELQAEVDRT